MSDRIGGVFVRLAESRATKNARCGEQVLEAVLLMITTVVLAAIAELRSAAHFSSDEKNQCFIQ